jgi:hypothetical protein
MSRFFTGFGEELLKLAQGASAGQVGAVQQQKKDVSPTAAAGKNLGIGSAAGQPEQPAGTPAATAMAGTGLGTPGASGKQQALKRTI